MQANQRQLLGSALAFSQSIVDSIREPLIVLDDRLRVRAASRSFYETFKATREETEGFPLYELGNRQWDVPGVDGCATSGMDHVCDRQCFEGRIQASEIVEIIEYGFCDLVRHGVRHARRRDDHGTDAKGADICRITRVRTAGYHRALVLGAFG